jgi:hypothetical protein
MTWRIRKEKEEGKGRKKKQYNQVKNQFSFFSYFKIYKEKNTEKFEEI